MGLTTTEDRSLRTFQIGSSEFQLPIARDLRQEVTIRFQHFYTGLGYAVLPALPIASRQDESTRFVGSITSTFKPHILGGTIPVPGFFLVQPCLRTQAVAKVFDTAKRPTYNSYFTQVGTLTPSGTVGRVYTESTHFLAATLNVPVERITVHVASGSTFEPVVDAQQVGVIVEKDAYGADYYRWGYGMGETWGMGLTFTVTAANGMSRDVGNIVVIYDGSGQELCVEWGIGIETFLSAAYGVDRVMQVTSICEVIPFEDGRLAKLIDTIQTIAIIYNEGITPGKKGQRWILKKFLKGLDYQITEYGIEPEQVAVWIDQFSQAEGLAPGIGAAVLEYIHQYRARFDNFHRGVAGLFEKSHRQPVRNMRESIEKLARVHGLNELELRRELGKYDDYLG